MTALQSTALSIASSILMGTFVIMRREVGDSRSSSRQQHGARLKRVMLAGAFPIAPW